MKANNHVKWAFLASLWIQFGHIKNDKILHHKEDHILQSYKFDGVTKGFNWSLILNVDAASVDCQIFIWKFEVSRV